MTQVPAVLLHARRFLPALLLSASALATASVAEASSPTANYVVPTKLEFFPDEATATKVVIHGAFFFWQKGGTYNQPACGYMYFACQAGQESMCRMQWSEIKNGIGQQQCQGFGQQNVMSTGTLRTEGTALGNADTWDLGLGVTPGVSVNGSCPPALALSCPLTSPADMATPSAVDMASGNPGGNPGGSTGSSHGGCLVAGASSGAGVGVLGGGLLLLGGALTALLGRRRGRRRSG